MLAVLALGIISLSACSRKTETELTGNTETSPAPGRPAAEALPDPKLVPLPTVNWADLNPSVRQQLRPIYEQAQLGPDDPEAVGRLCMMLHAYHKLELAEQCYQRARALAPQEFRWMYYLGVVSESLGKGPEALALIRAAVGLSPGYAPARVRLASLLLETGDLQASETHYRKAIDLDSKLPSAHYGLGKLLVARQQWEAAIDEYQQACGLDDNYAVAHYALGLAYRKVGATEKARAALRRYQQLRDLPEPSFDPVTDAVDAFVADAQKAPRPALDLPKSGLEKAAAELEHALEDQPWLLSAHANLIAIYWELGEPEKAEKHYRAAVKIDPNDAMIHYNWGLVQLLQGSLDAARQAFQKALKINPRYADAHVQLGVTLERQRNLSDAIRHYRIALESNPNHRRGHFRLGVALLRSGQPEEGIQSLHQTLEIEDEQTPRFMRALARAYAETGNRERALHYLRQARERAVSLGLTEVVAQLDSDLQLVAQAAPPR